MSSTENTDGTQKCNIAFVRDVGYRVTRRDMNGGGNIGPTRA